MSSKIILYAHYLTIHYICLHIVFFKFTIYFFFLCSFWRTWRKWWGKESLRQSCSCKRPVKRNLWKRSVFVCHGLNFYLLLLRLKNTINVKIIFCTFTDQKCGLFVHVDMSMTTDVWLCLCVFLEGIDETTSSGRLCVKLVLSNWKLCERQDLQPCFRYCAHSVIKCDN